MAKQKIPAGFRILIGILLFVITYLLIVPSVPASKTQISFWTWASHLFGEQDVEGFIGISVLVICGLVTVVGYWAIIRIAERKLNRLLV